MTQNELMELLNGMNGAMLSSRKRNAPCREMPMRRYLLLQTPRAAILCSASRKAGRTWR